MKKELLISSILILVGVILLPLSGCSTPENGGNRATPVSVKPDLPLLDTQAHGSVETAYFALG